LVFSTRAKPKCGSVRATFRLFRASKQPSPAGNMGDWVGRQGYMGGYGGLLGIIGQQGKNPLFSVKKFKIKTAILFLSFFWS
jgi:hypothetical protein